jgi:nucleotide-binding universal stress UspA family protein
MYKRILVPTDGSALARRGIKAGVALAKAVGASVVGYHAVEPIERIWYVEGVGIRAKEVEAARKSLWALGERYLDALRKEAAAAGVACDTIITDPADPFQGIIDAAKAKKCDAICMASHGRGAFASAMLGNVTHKVLTHTKIPVLVCR